MLYPDVDTPFADTIDVLNRLLPYHVFQQPQEDLGDIGRYLGKESKRKGKGKAMDGDMRDDIIGLFTPSLLPKVFIF